jgi:ubiquitin C-terminal hydrolase
LRSGGEQPVATYNITRSLVAPGPNLLVIQFRRRVYESSSGTYAYNAREIECPSDHRLDMTRAFGGQQAQYRLVACVNYHPSSVHYTADILRDGQWHHCNDSIVTRIAAPAAREATFLVLEKV